MRKLLMTLCAALCLLASCPAEASAAALTGTLVRSITLPQVPVVSQGWGVAIAPDDSVAYVCDPVGDQIFKITLSGSYTVTSWVTGLTDPNACVLTADGATLYVLLDAGAIYAVNTATGVASSAGTLNGLNGNTAGFSYLALSPDGSYLYTVYSSNKYVWRYKISDGSIATLAFTANRFTSGLNLSPDGKYLYFFASNSGPSTQGPLFRLVIPQGRVEVVAGTGANGNSDGEAYLVATITQSGNVVTDPTGAYVYFSSGNKLKVLSGGTVSQLTSNNWTTAGGTLAYFHLSDKIISTVGNTVYIIS